MAALIRSNHFKNYCADVYVKCCSMHGMSNRAAADKWNEEIFRDYTNLSWILSSVFPETKFNGTDYEFITSPGQIHVDKLTKKSVDVGRITITIKNGREYIFFENKNFRHGQVSATGAIMCYGGFGHNFSGALVQQGFSGALMEFYLFAKISDHATYVNNEAWN